MSDQERESGSVDIRIMKVVADIPTGMDLPACGVKFPIDLGILSRLCQLKPGHEGPHATFAPRAGGYEPHVFWWQKTD